MYGFALLETDAQAMACWRRREAVDEVKETEQTSRRDGFEEAEGQYTAGGSIACVVTGLRDRGSNEPNLAQTGTEQVHGVQARIGRIRCPVLCTMQVPWLNGHWCTQVP